MKLPRLFFLWRALKRRERILSLREAEAAAALTRLRKLREIEEVIVETMLAASRNKLAHRSTEKQVAELNRLRAESLAQEFGNQGVAA